MCELMLIEHRSSPGQQSSGWHAVTLSATVILIYEIDCGDYQISEFSVTNWCFAELVPLALECVVIINGFVIKVVFN